MRRSSASTPASRPTSTHPIRSNASCGRPTCRTQARACCRRRRPRHRVARALRPRACAGLLCDLLWSDPEADISGWAENDRGVSYTFGADVVSKFLQKHDYDLIVRAHQVVEDGYEFFADRQLVTLFSAPNYCGEFDNAGAVMAVDESLMCSFRILKPADKQKFSFSSNRPLTPPRKK